MLRNTILAILGFGVATMTMAQTYQPSEVIYKWKKGNITHYSMHPPRSDIPVTKLDKQGLVISDDAEDQAMFEAMRPRATPRQDTRTTRSSDSHTSNQSNTELPDGAITREQRCADAKRDIEVLRSTPANSPINVEDINGNLVPLKDDERQARLENAQALVDRLCNN